MGKGKALEPLCLLIDDQAPAEVCFFRSAREGLMQRLRATCAAVLVSSLLGFPIWGAGTPNVTPLGTVIAAERAHVVDLDGEARTTTGSNCWRFDLASTVTIHNEHCILSEWHEELDSKADQIHRWSFQFVHLNIKIIIRLHRQCLP